MIIITGLGNPRPKYKSTPHNVGFEVIDELKRKNDFPEFKFSKKFKSEISEKTINGEKIILAKPQTFMNASGEAVSSIINYYKMEDLKNLWIIHDDFDIPLSESKISENKSSAGHKGVRSIIDALNTKEFIRFRIGVKSQETSKDLKKIVLKKFKKEEKDKIKEVIEKTTETIKQKIEEK